MMFGIRITKGRRLMVDLFRTPGSPYGGWVAAEWWTAASSAARRQLRLEGLNYSEKERVG